ncbi:MAG TPA: hypothetical protein VGQ20_13780 [Acidimicrobiales bacterium]|nr:hypothetical protein [Acidimicrobiales bacterium]
MRMLELRLVDDRRSTLGLHPHLSVVTGLSAAARQLLARGLPELLRGADCGLYAQIERDGQLGELGADGAAAPLAGDAVADVVVRSRDIAESPSARAAGTSAPARPGDELARAQASAGAARASWYALDQAVEAVRRDHDAARVGRAQAEAAIRDARRDLDPYSAAARAAALAAAARVEVELGVSPGACRGDTLETVKDRIVLLEGQFRDMTTALDMLAAADPEPVAEALDVVRIVTATGPIAPPEALRLAEEWVSLREHLAALEAKIAADEGGVQAVSDRLEVARQELAACETLVTPAPIRDEDIHALEAIHEAVLTAERKASSRLGGAKARKALDDAVATEQAILDRLGYPTWSSWIMGARMLDSTAEHARRLEDARRELDDAAFAWDRLSARLEADPEFGALLDRLERVLDAAHAIVGEVDDVERALRDLRMDPGPPPCTVPEARQLLAAALRGADLDVEPDATLDELRLHAERWLARIRAVGSLRRQIEIDREHCAAELEVARESFERIEALGPVDAGDGFGSVRLAEAKVAIAAAEQRVNRHRSALSRVAHLVAEAGGLAELERQLAVAREAKEELLAITRQMTGTAESKVQVLEARAPDEAGGASHRPYRGEREDVEAVITYLDARFARVREMAGDSVPFLFDDSLAMVPAEHAELVLRWLVSASDETQILYLTDRPEVIAWAARRSPEYVAVIRGTGFFG